MEDERDAHTGNRGRGFIGTHLVERLLSSGDDVVVVDAFERQVHGDTPPELPAGVQVLAGA